MREATHFIEVWALSSGNIKTEWVRPIWILEFALEATKNQANCHTIAIFKIYPKKLN